MSAYSGTANLEAMTAAVRYNAHLCGLVRAHAGRARTLLDFGAGLGTFAGAVGGAGRRVVCVEPDETLAARLRAAGHPVTASAEALAPGSIDHAYTLNVLEHVDDDVAALRAIRRALRPGGTLLVYVPAFPVLWTAMDDLVGHRRRYTRRSLGSALDAAGFAVERCRYVDSLGFAASLAWRLAGGGGEIDAAAVRRYDRWVLPASLALDRATDRWFGKNVLAIARASRHDRDDAVNTRRVREGRHEAA